jgi:hypothetical protein
MPILLRAEPLGAQQAAVAGRQTATISLKPLAHLGPFRPAPALLPPIQQRRDGLQVGEDDLIAAAFR